jgi:D-alanyl-D-alanine carboxypeptidase
MRALFLPFALTLATCSYADELDKMAKAHMEAENVPGLAIGICKDGKLITERYYGYSNLETQRKVNPNTVFRIASMSKQFTASAAMLLIEEGKLSLETKIRTIFNEAPKDWEPITIHHLLTHTSGMPDPDGFSMSAQYTIPQFLSLFKKPLLSTPGDQYRYSNYGFSVLALAVEKVSGMPFRDFVRTRIFEPAGMNNSRYYTMDELVPDRANGYYYDPGKGYRNKLAARPQVYDGSGGVMTTLRDLAKWDAALRTNSPLSSNIKTLMWTPYTLNSGKQTTYGFGWTIRNGKYGPEISHNGVTNGFTSRWRRLLDKGYTVIIMRNGEGTDGGIAKLESDVMDWAVTTGTTKNLKGPYNEGRISGDPPF